MHYLTLYINFLKRSIQIERPLKVAFDCSNGVVGLVLKRIMNNELRIKNKKLRLIIHNSKFIILNSKPDGDFPAHGPDSMKKGALNDLRKAVLRQKADIGVIFDADGDRAFFMDNLGRRVDSDIIAYLLMLKGGFKPPYLIDVAEGKGPLRWFAPEMNIFETRTGHYFIKKIMRKKKIEFAAEHSGHYYFKDFFYSDSGIMAAIKVINAVSELPYSLADFINLLPPHYQTGEISIKYQMSGAKCQKLLKKIERRYKKQAINISRLDGLTMESRDWWFNLRPSNTESAIRLNIEAEDKKVLQKLKEQLTAALKSVI